MQYSVYLYHSDIYRSRQYFLQIRFWHIELFEKRNDTLVWNKTVPRRDSRRRTQHYIMHHEKDKMSRKKEQRARKKLLAMPWWKVKDNWLFAGILLVLFSIVVLAAFA
jgi:hypothetical protein